MQARPSVTEPAEEPVADEEEESAMPVTAAVALGVVEPAAWREEEERQQLPVARSD